jgi:putative OPT family oligopeptide transporter
LKVFRPYIPDAAKIRELTPIPLIVGTILGIIFGASSLYLVLKTGLTVSASIPVAVIAITLFRLLSKFGMRDATILENNVVQTAGSAGESIAFGVGVTMPAILILGFDLEFWRVTMVAVLGGLIGILMMIPLRRALIKDQHGFLKYPEGTACAEVLKAGASKESREASHEGDTADTDDAALQGGKIITIGFIIGFIYKTLVDVFSFFKGEPGKEMPENVLKGGSISLENNPALLGVGYIIGPYISSIMLGGGILSFLVLIPMIKYFGDGLTTPLAPGLATDPSRLIKDMSISDLRNAYILYIGAGAVVAGGLISLGRSIPTIWHGLKSGLADLRGSRAGDDGTIPRTDQDLSMKWVVIGILLLVIVITFIPTLKVGFFGALLIIIFGFLFVTVSSRLTGEVGSSSNPISGMTVATLLFTCLIFLALGWTAPDPYFVTALSVGGIVCIAASNGGTTSQDLKTGFLVGSTPRHQQVAILIGALASALILGPLLLWLNDAKTLYQKVEPTAFSANFRVAENQLGKEGANLRMESVKTGKYAGTDKNSYHVWHNTDKSLGGIGKYLVDNENRPVYFVDPAINGAIKKDENDNEIERYDAPKATLMSYIIKGILGGDLPWGLVIMGAMIAVVLELTGIPSLAFAVGIYLPISTSAPIFVGGAIRWAVDLYLKRKLARRNLSEEQIIAETDKSNGVLIASGYIAGAAVAGILFAIFAFLPALASVQKNFGDWSSGKLVQNAAKWVEQGRPSGANYDWFLNSSEGVRDFLARGNVFFDGRHSDWLAMIPFWILALILYYVGRELLFTGKKRK